MKYYIFEINGELNGAGQCPVINEEVNNIEVSEELFNSYIETPDKYIYLENEIIIDPNYEEKQKQKERERINKLSLTKREVFLAIYKDKQITPEQIRSMIVTEQGRIEFDYANDYFRGNPLIDQLGLALGYTTEQLDYLFQYKEFPKMEVK